MYRKILVPLDGSKLAENALTDAIDQARPGGAEVVLLGVVAERSYAPMLPNESLSYLETMSQASEVAVAEDMRRMNAYFGPLVDKVKTVGLPVSSAVVAGPTAESIVDYARDNGIDLIVMSTHGRTGLGRFLLGSVAERVLRAATVPALLVRAKEA